MMPYMPEVCTWLSGAANNRMPYSNPSLVTQHNRHYLYNFRDVMWCDDVIWCDVMWDDVIWWCGVMGDVMWWGVVWCSVVWCDVMWWCDVMMWCDDVKWWCQTGTESFSCLAVTPSKPWAFLVFRDSDLLNIRLINMGKTEIIFSV